MVVINVKRNDTRVRAICTQIKNAFFKTFRIHVACSAGILQEEIEVKTYHFREGRRQNITCVKECPHTI